MQVFEVKNDIAEILYEPNENELFLSDFLFLEDDESTIVSQVTNISTTEQANINIATVQFYLSIDKSNKLSRYNGHTPSKNSDVGCLDAEEIIGLFRPKNREILWGKYIRDTKLSIATDMRFLSSNCCVICDRAMQSVSIIKTLLKSLSKTRVLVLDFDGKYTKTETDNNAEYGKDFRIPLDSKALDYIFEQDLTDCPIEAKAIIQNIILEIQKYVESTEKGFLPFSHFINIVMAECKNSKDSGLLIFCNKLLQYKQKKIFADDEKQFSIIDNSEGSLKIDISDVDTKYHNLILNSIFSNVHRKTYIISDISEENISNSTIKRVYENSTIRLIPIISHEDKYLNKIKSYCKNLVIYAPAARKKSEEPYASFIDKLSQNSFILWGEGTLFIPLIAEENDSDNFEENIFGRNITDAITVSDLDDLDAINNANIILQQPVKDEVTTEDLDSLEQDNNIDTFEDIQEQNINEDENSDYLLDFDGENEEIIINEEPEEILDVEEEKVSDEQALKSNENLQSKQKQIKISASETVQEPLPQEKKPIQQNNFPDSNKQQQTDSKYENLPIYEPKEVNNPINEEFKEGNRVIHAKYGEGTIEQIISYGKKTLFSIQFDNVGRRLLDPKITTINKV
ncbi:MAG: hypothetical protein ACI37T_07960 [Candidatus Gastranaerophilaceae bacterium]